MYREQNMQRGKSNNEKKNSQESFLGELRICTAAKQEAGDEGVRLGIS
jgi:hypothetical protein